MTKQEIVSGHFYFTKLLLPVLESTAKDSPEKHVRVVTTSSSAHAFHEAGIRYETLRDSAARTKFGTNKLYYQSKFAVVLFSRELAKRYGDQGIVSVSLNPGNLKTDLQRHLTSGRQKAIVRFVSF